MLLCLGGTSTWRCAQLICAIYYIFTPQAHRGLQSLATATVADVEEEVGSTGVVDAVVPCLKGIKRATVKTHEKYVGVMTILLLAVFAVLCWWASLLSMAFVCLIVFLVCTSYVSISGCFFHTLSEMDACNIIYTCFNYTRFPTRYHGRYDALTDLARMTFSCASPRIATATLRFVNTHTDWRVVRIKNRLMPQYDASPGGGYRDILVNAVYEPTGHIVEIQITLSAFLDIKKSGGHAVYKLARLLELNQRETTCFEGPPGSGTRSNHNQTQQN